MNEKADVTLKEIKVFVSTESTQNREGMTLGDHYVKMFCSDFIPDGWYQLYNTLNENEKSFVCKYLILKTQRAQSAGFITRLRYLFTGEL